ncbi:MAG: NUDIX domain-containing protein [Parcubacteria group bacterium]|nr:NUDIX domain-containing protein [Parcubacteria group bacterium]
MEIIDKLGWIYIKDKKLLGARSKGKNVYYIPGGKREQRETDKEALIREIKEELDIELIPKSLRFINKFKAQAHGQPEGIILQMTCYSADFIGGINPSSEIEEVTWLTNKDKEGATPMIKIILDWFKGRDLID